MTENRKLQPTILYSDFFILKKNVLFENTFLEERLKDIGITSNKLVEDSGKKISLSWKAKGFNYPEKIFTTDSLLRLKENDDIQVSVEEEKISKIAVNGTEREAIALEPVPVAQLAGATREIRRYTKLDEIPTPLVKAIIAIEDQRFLEHLGFDPRSLARAIWINIRSGHMAQGGSTITQQLVKNLLDSNQKTFVRKFRELVLAILLEVKYSKDEILEKYLNEVYVGQVGSLEVHGMPEAARLFFNKSLNQLNLAEMALMAGIIKGPAYYSPYRYQARALERKDLVLKKMGDLKIITQNQLKDALQQQMSFASPSLVNNKAPYFIDFVKSQVLEQLGQNFSAEDFSSQGLKVFTTLDLPLQRRADQAVLSTVRELAERFKIQRPLRLEGLLITAEPKEGFVKAIVGGRSFSETTFNRALNMKRQAGSTFKPFAYLAAFEKGKNDAGEEYKDTMIVEDEPWTYKYGKNKVWSPKNYEKTYRGKIPLREAFANSINIPIAKIGVDVGAAKIAEVAHRLGVKENLPEIPSLPLGSVEVHPFDILQAYCTLANKGEYHELTTVRLILNENNELLAQFNPKTATAFDSALIEKIHSLLRSVVLEGTSKSLATMGYTKTAYGKTGTTSFYRDAWFAGFSEGLVALTWTGFDELKIPDEDDEKAQKTFKAPALLTGASAALPSWAKFFISTFPSKKETNSP